MDFKKKLKSLLFCETFKNENRYFPIEENEEFEDIFIGKSYEIYIL